MKKLALAAAGLIVLAFIIITIARLGSDDPVDRPLDERSAERGAQREDFWSVYHKAEKEKHAGNLQAAINGFLEALKIDSVHENSLYYLGSALNDAGQGDSGVAVLEKLISVNRMSARAHHQIARILASPEPGATLDFTRAQAHIDEVLRLNKEESGPFYSLGLMLSEQGSFEEARKQLRSAIETNPSHIKALRLLGYLGLRQGDNEGAVDNYLRALKAGDRSVRSRPGTGEGDTEQSLLDFDPYSSTNIASLFGLAVAAQLNGGYSADIPEKYRLDLPATTDMTSRVPTADNVRTLSASAPISRVFSKHTKPPTKMPDGLSFSQLTIVVPADFNRDGSEDLLLAGIGHDGIAIAAVVEVIGS
ncbi:MAG: tetratricopeptide repeat protein, partial [candidate division Zixibacteria bacterium]